MILGLAFVIVLAILAFGILGGCIAWAAGAISRDDE